MKINEQLKVINLTNIETFKVDGITYPLDIIIDKFADYEFQLINITTYHKELKDKDVRVSVVTDNIDEALSVIDVAMQLPNAPLYISICLDFITKGGTL